ncbi:DUF4855 domain-containing protein [Desulfolucanica intricata]|uniref:DUF4855 domain-containing protein n=1 Tax=Desulfolucanica intricata TaxID=1285191 RepID=UPI000834BAFA|nr:DUF4855 domain-containing protein [Desulfolucanica intricata]
MSFRCILVLLFSLSVLLGANVPPAAAVEPLQPVGNSTPVEIAPFTTYTIEQHAPDKAFRQKEYKNYSGPVEGLASLSEAWTGFFRQQGRDITVNLGQVRTITQISLEFKQDRASGILLPKYMQATISMDGKKWSYLGRVSPGYTDLQARTLLLSFPPVSARYVKISFPVEYWVFARHLSIKSPEHKEQPVILAHAENTAHVSDTLLQIPDINDILLIYSGLQHNEGTWTGKDFLPLIGYIDPIGVLKDKMFDTMLFLPFPEMEATKEGWTAYLDHLFAPGAQLNALDKAAAEMNEIPYLQGRKKVILTLPYPDTNQQNFGSLEEGKESLSFSVEQVGRDQALENRFMAVQWYYNQLTDKWNLAEFKYLDLVGIYWYQETMDQSIAGELELVQKAARLVQDSGQKFFWIPYYGSSGYNNWQTYGFDYVFLQPNYYATDDPTEERMDNVTDLARQHHLGIELECDDRVTYSRYYYDLFYKQLNKAHQLGLDGTVTNAYYAGTKTLVKAQQSLSPQIRAIYDDIYKWIHGTYQEKNN